MGFEDYIWVGWLLAGVCAILYPAIFIGCFGKDARTQMLVALVILLPLAIWGMTATDGFTWLAVTPGYLVNRIMDPMFLLWAALLPIAVVGKDLQDGKADLNGRDLVSVSRRIFAFCICVPVAVGLGYVLFHDGFRSGSFSDAENPPYLTGIGVVFFLLCVGLAPILIFGTKFWKTGNRFVVLVSLMPFFVAMVAIAVTSVIAVPTILMTAKHDVILMGGPLILCGAMLWASFYLLGLLIKIFRRDRV